MEYFTIQAVDLTSTAEALAWISSNSESAELINQQDHDGYSSIEVGFIDRQSMIDFYGVVDPFIYTPPPEDPEDPEDPPEE